jgi:hypothetical protein
MEAPRLDDLIELVRAQAAADDPIEQLRTAAALKADLDELTDALLGHFVDQARRAGASWSQIGDALGVSKQAVQQKHTSTESVAKRLLAAVTPSFLREGPGFLTRFTPRAKAVVVAAQRAAVGLGHPTIGTEHVVLGFFAESDSIAALLLREAGITADELTNALLERVPMGSEAVTGHVPFSPAAKKALELALREAVALGHNYIGTEHQLLGVLREGGLGAELLIARGLTHGVAQQGTIRLLSGAR